MPGHSQWNLFETTRKLFCVHRNQNQRVQFYSLTPCRASLVSPECAMALQLAP